MSRFFVVLIASLVVGITYSSAQSSNGNASLPCGIAWDGSDLPCALDSISLNFTLTNAYFLSTWPLQYGASAPNYVKTQPAHTLAIKFSAPSNNSNPTLTMDLSGIWNSTTLPLSISARLCDVNGGNCTAYDTAAINSTHIYSVNLNNTIPGGAYHPFAFAFIQFQDVPGHDNANWNLTTTALNDGMLDDIKTYDGSPNAAWQALFNETIVDPKIVQNIVLSLSIQ